MVSRWPQGSPGANAVIGWRAGSTTTLSAMADQEAAEPRSMGLTSRASCRVARLGSASMARAAAAARRWLSDAGLGDASA